VSLSLQPPLRLSPTPTHTYIAQAKELTKEILSKFDGNHDGQISRGEFGDVLEYVRFLTGLKPRHEVKFYHIHHLRNDFGHGRL
jgi:hypothetical protein